MSVDVYTFNPHSDSLEVIVGSTTEKLKLSICDFINSKILEYKIKSTIYKKISIVQIVFEIIIDCCMLKLSCNVYIHAVLRIKLKYRTNTATDKKTSYFVSTYV